MFWQKKKKRKHYMHILLVFNNRPKVKIYLKYKKIKLKKKGEKRSEFLT